MNNLNKKQKVIVVIIISIIAIGIYYIVYAKDSEIFTTKEENIEIIDKQNDNETENHSNAETNKESIETNEKVIVHISGAVNIEGIVELEENSRIADAIEKAGGLKENADMDKINLAYIIEDGMKVYIPTKGENKTEEYVTTESGINAEDIQQEKSNTTVSKQASKVNINTATQAELESLPGIGPSTALKIIEYRKEKGKFKSIEDIKEVSGIGESKFNQIKSLISI